MRSPDASDPPGGPDDDFDPAQLTIGPDGGVDQTAKPGPVMRPPPRLCEQGPCVHYHRFTVPFDAEVAKAASIEPGGRMVGRAPPERLLGETHHYCYPTVGIEFPLEAPVIRCSLWEPRGASDSSLVELKRTKFLETPAGQAYTADLAAWEAERDAVKADPVVDSELAAWLTMHLRDGDALEIRKAATIGQDAGSPIVTYIAPLREGQPTTLPPGSYRAWIIRNATNISSKLFEVPHVDG